jgi:hypothetical protein
MRLVRNMRSLRNPAGLQAAALILREELLIFG